MVENWVEVDAEVLRAARDITGSTSDQETVEVALRVLIALHRQPGTVERIISRGFGFDQLDASTIWPGGD